MRRLIIVIPLAAVILVPGIGAARGGGPIATSASTNGNASVAAVGDGIDTQPVTYKVKGDYVGDQTVRATKGNRHADDEAGLIGTDVRYDMTVAPIDVADANDDGYEDFRDLQSGEQVLVKSDLPKNDPGPQPLAVRFVRSLEHPSGR